ncbi:unnamed protein product, partial [Urochloa humidicola]
FQGRHPLLHLLLLRPIPTRARRTTTTSSCAPDSPDLRPQLPPPPPRRRGGSCRPVPLGGVAPPLHPLPLPSATSADGPAERPASVSAMAPLVAARDAEQSRPGGGQNSGEAGADLGGGQSAAGRICGGGWTSAASAAAAVEDEASSSPPAPSSSAPSAPPRTWVPHRQDNQNTNKWIWWIVSQSEVLYPKHLVASRRASTSNMLIFVLDTQILCR